MVGLFYQNMVYILVGGLQEVKQLKIIAKR